MSLLLWLVTLTPAAASHVAATAVGAPELGKRLARICWRESRCSPVGVHRGDSGHSSTVFEKAQARGWTCSNHELGNGRRWSTRGAWGTMAGYTLHYLPWPLRCAPPEFLDWPLFGALAAALRLKALRRNRHPALVAWATKGIMVRR